MTGIQPLESDVTPTRSAAALFVHAASYDLIEIIIRLLQDFTTCGLIGNALLSEIFLRVDIKTADITGQSVNII